MDTHGTKFHIAICDDVEKDREYIAHMTQEIMASVGVRCDIAAFDCGKTLLGAIQNGSEFDILLLDVMMDEMGGMELARLLREQNNKSSIIFISTNRELALYGYEVSAVRYLAKPVDGDKLREALLYCYGLYQNKKEILLPTDRGQYRISFADIQFAEAFDRGTRFHFARETVESRMKFSEAQAWLPKSVFLACHRAFIVNLSTVRSIRNYEFTLNGGKTVPISKNRYTEVYKSFVEYITNQPSGRTTLTL